MLSLHYPSLSNFSSCLSLNSPHSFPFISSSHVHCLCERTGHESLKRWRGRKRERKFLLKCEERNDQQQLFFSSRSTSWVLEWATTCRWPVVTAAGQCWRRRKERTASRCGSACRWWPVLRWQFRMVRAEKSPSSSWCLSCCYFSLDKNKERKFELDEEIRREEKVERV